MKDKDRQTLKQAVVDAKLFTRVGGGVANEGEVWGGLALHNTRVRHAVCMGQLVVHNATCQPPAILAGNQLLKLKQILKDSKFKTK